MKIGKVHGAELHTDITREIFLPVGAGHIESGTPVSDGVEGGINANAPDVYFWMKVPVDFVSFTSVKAIWMSEAAVGNMYWQLVAKYEACGEEMEKHTDEPAIGVTATGGELILNCQEPANALTLASLAVGDFIILQFYREGSNALDTLDSEAYLVGLLFTYVANQ